MISHVNQFINLESKKFFTVPRPLSNELLSSWLIRVAMAHDTQPRSFMNIHFPKTNPSFWSKDVDIYWGNNFSFLSLLSYKSNIAISKLYQMTLQSYSGYLSEKISINTQNKSITPIKNRGRTHHSYGTRFCPECISTDRIPYYRKQWRLSFVTCCINHQCYLQDRCPSCSKPITPYIVREKEEYFHCNLCKYPIWKAPVQQIPPNSYGVTAQNNLLSILNNGYFNFQQETYFSLAYFPVLHQISKLLYNGSLHLYAFNHECLYTSKSLPKFNQKPSFYIEDSSIQNQYLIYSSAEYLLQSKGRMKQLCQANHLGKGLLTHSMRYIPFWFSYIVTDNDTSTYSVALEEIKSLIFYFEKNNIPINLKNLSKYLHTTLDSRKRPDIIKLIYIKNEI